MGRRPGRGATPSILFGAIIIAVGLFLLLQNLGIVRVHDVWQFWPVVLIVIGIARLLDSRTPSAMIFGGLFVAVGGLLLADNLGILYVSFDFIWPLILIGFGASLLWRTLDSRRQPSEFPIPGSADVHAFAIFGGSKRRIESADFRGGDMVSVFGGVELDLRGSMMPSRVAAIEVNTVFGGVEITTPEDWVVDCQVISILGGVEDKTRPSRGPVQENPPRLVITGYCVFGGLSLKN
jgi:predicted membrane protein